MSNSSLISGTLLSPNHSGKRNQKISKITIHHMAGIMTAKACCQLFNNTARQASANYCIGNDGEIWLCVDESNRAWTSASEWNDNRAVTIEVSNNVNGSPWTVSDKAFNSLIKLCIDICKRNGIEELTYDGTKNGTLTFHEMFAATNCPGPYIKKRVGDICAQVNAGLGVASSVTQTTTPDQVLTVGSKIKFPSKLKVEKIDIANNLVYNTRIGGWVSAEICTEDSTADGKLDQILNVGSTFKISGEYTVSKIQVAGGYLNCGTVYLKELGYWVNAEPLIETKNG
jgi:hypothetical protein